MDQEQKPRDALKVRIRTFIAGLRDGADEIERQAAARYKSSMDRAAEDRLLADKYDSLADSLDQLPDKAVLGICEMLLNHPSRF